MKLAALAGVFMLAGCGTSGPTRDDGPTPDADGVPCADSAGAPSVYIDVGAPPPVCEVDPDTAVTWRGAPGADGFQIRFTSAASPAGPRAARSLNSTSRGGRQKIVLTARNASGTYNYEILTATGGVDPAIIIRAR
ncbi:hypothetical protein [Lysobacter sp. F6437]|uniref:hypothetical protein n=1 Tax=Lysobacter sp. F6437 TaxID=3459296 RepID=UPI00403DF3E6